MKVIKRYLSAEITASTLLVFGALLMLFAFLDMIHELGDLGRGNYRLYHVMGYVLLSLPGHVYELFPIAALIGTLFALAQLVASSEYTVMRVSGASLLQVGWALLRIGIPLSIVTFLAGEFVAPQAALLSERVRAQSRGNAAKVVAQQFKSGFWFKQDQTYVNIRSVLSDLSIAGVSIYEFDNDFRLRNMRTAESGTFTGSGHWRLKNVRATEIAMTGTRVTETDTYTWETVLRPSLLTVYQVAPEKLELNTLWENMRLLGTTQKTTRFEIAFWNKVFYPAAVLVMMIVALPFSYFQRRQGGVGFRIFSGTMLGLMFFLTGRIFSNLGVLNDWPALFSAAFPLVVFVVLTASMLWWLERL
jgi:lipopolysaccharide export system permease protein